MLCVRTSLRAALVAAALFGAASAAEAAGAIAIGACAAYGYAYDHPNADAAKTAAMANCSGGACKQVVSTSKGCAAFAIDGRKPCGPSGYASAVRLGEAQNTALKFCYKHGGKDCVIRAWICDGKG
jgi:hypothetical protein